MYIEGPCDCESSFITTRKPTDKIGIAASTVKFCPLHEHAQEAYDFLREITMWGESIAINKKLWLGRANKLLLKMEGR